MTVPYTHMKPADIEKRSFEIIEQTLAESGICLDPVNAPVIRRCIHTSADFDYAQSLYFSPDAVASMQRIIAEGCTIVTDTQMGMAGINKRVAAGYGTAVRCFMADDDVAEEAKARSVTRALVSMERAMRLNGPVLFAIGNAPTALIRLHEAMHNEGYAPAGIIAAPVGFVNVIESKELIVASRVPRIVARGRKGGSNIAAAICNALLYGLGG